MKDVLTRQEIHLIQRTLDAFWDAYLFQEHMANQSQETKDARRLEKLYNTKAHGTGHQRVIQLLRERGLEGTIRQLEDWGMKAEPEKP